MDCLESEGDSGRDIRGVSGEDGMGCEDGGGDDASDPRVPVVDVDDESGPV